MFSIVCMVRFVVLLLVVFVWEMIVWVIFLIRCVRVGVVRLVWKLLLFCLCWISFVIVWCSGVRVVVVCLRCVLLSVSVVVSCM